MLWPDLVDEASGRPLVTNLVVPAALRGLRVRTSGTEQVLEAHSATVRTPSESPSDARCAPARPTCRVRSWMRATTPPLDTKTTRPARSYSVLRPLRSADRGEPAHGHRTTPTVRILNGCRTSCLRRNSERAGGARRLGRRRVAMPARAKRPRPRGFRRGQRTSAIELRESNERRVPI